MEILDLKLLEVGDTFTDAAILIAGMSLCKSKLDQFYIAGLCRYKEMTLPFKIWDSIFAEAAHKYVEVGTVVTVSGTVSIYNESIELVIKDISPTDEIDKKEFYKTAPIESLVEDLNHTLRTNLSAEAFKVANKVILNNPDILYAFEASFAGKVQHDAQIGGLLNHTLKMLKIGLTLLSNDERLSTYKDTLLLGILFHDLGKIYEMDFGKYTKMSFVTHRTIGVEIINNFKSYIIETVGERMYYDILAIIIGHHGDWGDKPRTVCAYITHLIDVLDSSVTGICDKIEAQDVRVDETGNKSVYCNNHNLVI
jgi:3'-5' exoribonuclease